MTDALGAAIHYEYDPASSLIAVVTSWLGSWTKTIGAGAGTCSGSRLSCAGCTVVLLAR